MFDEDEEYFLPVSTATYEDIAARMEASGMAPDVIVMLNDGRITPAIQFGNVTLFPDGGPDTQINSGQMADYEIALGEEAFRAGYTASEEGGHSVDHAWSLYTPSEALLEDRP